MGGKKFEAGSPAYAVLARWIASGMPGAVRHRCASGRARRHAGDSTLAPGIVTPLTVRARFSDGASEDVTVWSRFASADETVAQVDDRGQVTVNGPGETAVSVGFLTGVAMTRVRSPFPMAVSGALFANAARHNRIDDLVIDKLRQMQIPPSALAGDAVFIRRAYPGRRRHPADAQGGRGVCGRHFARQARPAGGRVAAAAGVRGLLGLQVVRLAAGLEPIAQPQQRPRVLRLDSPERRRQHAMEPLRLRADDGLRAHRRERRRQLLPDPPQPDRHRRELHAGVSRPDDHLRAVPQPPDGEVDADRLLRVCEPVRARRDEGRRRGQRQGRHRDDSLHCRRRHPAPAPGRGDAAAAPRRRADGQSRAGGSPRLCRQPG